MTTIAVLVLQLCLPLIGEVEPVNVAGKWNLTLELESITGHPIVTLKQDGEKLTGTYQGRYGEFPVKGTLKDKAIEFTVTMVAEGTQTQGVFQGKVDGDTMGGSVTFEGAGDGSWTASRAKP
jgi:hypothetical protein